MEVPVLGWVLAGGALGQDVCVQSERCPGPTSVRVERVTPGGPFRILVTDRGPGVAPVPAGPCRGVATGLASVDPGARLAADALGRGLLNLTTEQGQCGRLYVQVLDETTCRLSRVADLRGGSCRTGGVLIGSFTVAQGPPWPTATPQSCLEACAAQFGGEPLDYQCSTSDQVVDGLAYVDGWGDDQYCWSPVPDAWKKGVKHDCGAEGCSYSAFVDDHSCPTPNWCWSRDPR